MMSGLVGMIFTSDLVVDISEERIGSMYRPKSQQYNPHPILLIISPLVTMVIDFAS
jgi:hypothetical protein